MSDGRIAAEARPNVQLRQIGKPLPRIDARAKATGRTLYAGDYVMPGMLHAKIVRSPMASAMLGRIDASKARALEGVRCVLTHEDIGGMVIPTDIPGQTGKEALESAQPLLVKDRVRYHGEPLAVVAAETRDLAEQAARLVEYELAPFPGVFSPEDALEPGAPVVQAPDNVVAHRKIRKGDPEAGFAAADVIVENTYRTQFVEHAFLEPEVGLAWVDEHDVVNIRSATQVIEHYRTIAKMLGVPQNRIRIRGAMVGGGFGGKEDITVEAFLAILARRTGRPVRMEFTREDSFLGHAKRHPFTMRYRTGVTRDGKIAAVEARMLADAGAYVYLSPYVVLLCAIAAPGPYRVDNLLVDARAVATNNMFTSAFRGFGSAQACIAYEQQMDEVAKAIGMDRIEFRRRNYLRTGDAISTGFVPPSAIWTETCVDIAWAELGSPSPGSETVRIGRGVAASQQSYGRVLWLKDTAEAWVGIELDGSVTVRSGIPDIGAGQASALAQIAAEVLGVGLQDVSVYSSDTAVTPLAGTTTATRGVFMSGNAVREASEKIRARLAARAAQALGVDPGAIDIAAATVFVVDDERRSMPLADLVKLCASEGIHRSELAIFRAPTGIEIDPETGQGQAHPDYAFGAHAAEVAVDIETGEVTVLKSVSVHDVGQAINADAAKGQIEGAVAQGIGFALSEEAVYREGVLASHSLSEYLIPTAMDVPEMKSILLESRSGLGPFGSKGVGEPSLIPVAPSIANAVADAVGTRIFDLPITPEKIVRAWKERGGGHS